VWKLWCIGKKPDTSLKYGRTQAAADLCRNHNIEKDMLSKKRFNMNGELVHKEILGGPNKAMIIHLADI
jgi:hypothetical protein